VIAPALEYCFTLSIELGPPQEIGQTAPGLRRVVPITGGTVDGPRFTGTILPGGADYQFVRADGVTELEAHYVVENAAGDRVYIENRGYRTASPDDVQRLLRGEPVDPARVYFRTNPRFEASAPDLQWLTRTLFVASAERDPDAVRVHVFAVS
jgi:hypothetical protein